MKKLVILNGPNLNLLGKREPSIYGNTSFDDVLSELKKEFSTVEFSYFQSNHEGELIDKIHLSDGQAHGIILNAGAYTHTSIALADAISSVSTPVVEVHISNVYGREAFRKNSYISSKCKGSISGFGMASYRLAVLSFLS